MSDRATSDAESSASRQATPEHSFSRAILTEVSLLKGVSTETLEHIAAVATPRSVSEGDILYELGDLAREVYILSSGRLRFSLGVGADPTGGGSIVVPHGLLGWAALLGDQPRRIATVIALDESHVLSIPATDLICLFEKDQVAGYIVMRRLARLITVNFLEQLSSLASL